MTGPAGQEPAASPAAAALPDAHVPDAHTPDVDLLGAPDQLELPGMPAQRRRPAPGAQAVTPADELPVASVVVEVPVLRLDHTYDYLVPVSMADGVAPGVRVKVRFGAQDVDGYVLERRATTAHEGTLRPLRRLVSTEPVLPAASARLARTVAEHYAGSMSDVVRLAVPPRHARTEGEPLADDPGPDADGAEAEPVTPGPWADLAGGEAFLRHAAAGAAVRGVWSALPGRWAPGGAVLAEDGWELMLARAVRTVRDAGRGALVVLPDARDVDRLARSLDATGMRDATASGGTLPDADGRAHGYVRLLADDGPAQRYRAFLAVLRGHARVVVGTRAAAFAPVSDLGLAVVWEDDDQLHSEQRAPYPHVREVLALRSETEGCALLVAGLGRSVEAQALVRGGWAHEIGAPRAVVRERTARVRALTRVEVAREGPAAVARIPSAAWRLAREGLARGPVLVQVPRAGYVPVTACATCREPASCPACHGPLGLSAGSSTPQCRWCGRLAAAWTCARCHGGTLRSVLVGSERTAEELGRAFSNVPVRVSGARSAGGVLASVSGASALVVATPGAEPVAAGGYAAALLLDAGVATSGTHLRTRQDAARRWFTAASLVRPAAAGGIVAVVGDGDEVVTGALVRWDPVGLAERELDERAELGLPPAVRVGALTGPRQAVAAVLAEAELPPGASALGPVPVAPADGGSAVLGGELGDVRAIVRAPRAEGRGLAAALRAAVAGRGARRGAGTVRLHMDVADLV
ncbi:primosomal protein N' [Sanguibacter sp. HDW7]|uniref:primosomal protein N' family DNA-binding protein n=1 Tax=Sanguibacter sp. HDW7 TaxID=2714931 RepID=UPI00140C5425|nr:primosomal protein N' [Sanguibacter sp. HDW7]QIK83556.1 primosomal protein N' [Sanguibacter sp. HDW7]